VGCSASTIMARSCRTSFGSQIDVVNNMENINKLKQLSASVTTRTCGIAKDGSRAVQEPRTRDGRAVLSDVLMCLVCRSCPERAAAQEHSHDPTRGTSRNGPGEGAAGSCGSRRRIWVSTNRPHFVKLISVN
jgi:hypothetical protein